MTLTSFFMVVGLIGLVAFIGTVIYFHKQEITGTGL
jgi:flagellar biogenesis protein FliO